MTHKAKVASLQRGVRLIVIRWSAQAGHYMARDLTQSTPSIHQPIHALNPFLGRPNHLFFFTQVFKKAFEKSARAKQNPKSAPDEQQMDRDPTKNGEENREKKRAEIKRRLMTNCHEMVL